MLKIEISETSMEHLTWVLVHISAMATQAKKVLVFACSIDSTAALHGWAGDILDSRGSLFGGDRCVEIRIIEMSHYYVNSDTQDIIIEEFLSPNSNYRLLFSTIKIGMGMDIRILI